MPKERGAQQASQGFLRVFQRRDVIDQDMFVENDVKTGIHLERYLTAVVVVCAISAIIGAIVTFGWESQVHRAMLIVVVVDTFLSIAGGWLAYQSLRIRKRLRSMTIDRTILSPAGHQIESETLIRALEVFGSSDRAIEWMREKNPALGNQPPIRVIQTEAGGKAVRDVLGRIEHGVIS
ncbi:MAG TPA: MbcA/ParS/Xre antitoxin family protein [Bryobacteraceae bacterium]|nr:MbcA/ParS/Xre antitoxin family protein [Bryobacteraceae bacterium]